MAPSDAIEAAPIHDQTAFRIHLLAVMNQQPGAKGLALKAELDQMYEQEINHGRLYPNLDALVEQGLVSKGKADDRTNTYELTRRGRRELAAHVAWLNEMAGDLLD